MEEGMIPTRVAGTSFSLGALFLVDSNDLHLAIKYSEVHQFSDDNGLLRFNSSVNSINKQINRDFKKFIRLAEYK